MNISKFRKVDYLIIGQGVAGSSLALALMALGARVLVMDDGVENTASRRAAAVLHAYHSKDWTHSATQEKYLGAALTLYESVANESRVDFLHPSNLLLWNTNTSRAAAEDGFAAAPDCILQNVWQIRAGQAIDAFKKILLAKESYLEQSFDSINMNVDEHGITYQNIAAEKVIFCEGARINSMFRGQLPFTTNRGDVLILRIPGLAPLQNQPQQIFQKNELRLLPLGGDMYWCGSNNVWKLDDMKPSETFKKAAITLLDSWLSVPYKIIDHLVTQRPTTAGQFPLIGLLQQQQIGIFNGLGTRGYLRAPYYAAAFAKSLLAADQEISDYDSDKFRQLAQNIRL